MTKRLIILTMLFLGLLLTAGCSLLPSSQNRRGESLTVQDGSTPTPIPTPIVPTKPEYEVKRGEVVEKIEFTGRISPVEEQELFFRDGGWVRNVYIERDDFVEEGQVLADLEIDDLERELESRQLDLKRVEAQLAEAERNLATEMRRAEIDRDIALLSLEAARNSDLTPRQQQAAVGLERSLLQLKQAQEAYDDIAWRNDRSSRAEADSLQAATLDYEEAKATYDLAMQDIANQKYDIAILERQVDLTDIRLDELSAGINPLLINDVEQAELAVEKLKASIVDSQIIAPFDGQILSEILTEGREVTNHKTMVVIADLSEMEISADLTDKQMEELSEGMAVLAYRTNSPGDQYTGYIHRLPYPFGGGGRATTAAEQDDISTRIRLEIPVEELDIELGSLMTIEVVLEQKDDVLWLPPHAIRKFEGRKFVVVKDGDAQRRVDVTTGVESEDRIEIEEGLTEGQIVIAP